MSTPDSPATAAAVPIYFSYAEWKCPVCGFAQYGKAPNRLSGERWKSRPCGLDPSHTPWPKWPMGSLVRLERPVATWAEVLAIIAAKDVATTPPPDQS